MTQLDLQNSFTCLCCDLPIEDCQTYGQPRFNISQISIEDYMIDHHIMRRDIYNENFSDCCTCQFYMTDACVPLRNIIRFYHQAKVIPSFNLVGCYDYEQNDDADEYLNALSDQKFQSEKEKDTIVLPKKYTL